MIADKMTGSTLEDIAQSFNVQKNSSKAVSLASPALPGVGSAPELIGALIGLEANKVYKKIEGKNGMFSVKMTNIETPAKLENYKSFSSTIQSKMQGKTNKAYDALKKFADIEDNRATFY